MTIRIAIVGIGKIARDQHLPTLSCNPNYELVAAVNRSGPLPGTPTFATIEELIANGPPVDAVAICTPPVGRHAIARTALGAGMHVMLEKPPGATVSEVEDLVAVAKACGRTLFATWHSREAPAVEPARQWLADKPIRAVAVRWLEDVRRWHPGQSWIWEPGGFGVFDPGINALSILTAIMPRPLFLTAAELYFPANKATPIAAKLSLGDAAATPVSAELDWRQTGEQIWSVMAQTDAGDLHFCNGGSTLTIDGEDVAVPAHSEYSGLYRRFAALVASQRTDVDLAPFKLASDAFMIGRRMMVDSFVD